MIRSNYNCGWCFLLLPVLSFTEGRGAFPPEPPPSFVLLLITVSLTGAGFQGEEPWAQHC